MLGGSNEITVVSMTHQIESYNSNISYTNYIGNDNGWIRNNVTNIGKTGVYGYSYKNNATNINNILGDKNDYNTEGNLLGIDSVFSVVGRSDTVYSSKVAWYWTFIANRALTSDEINQVIAYYNLDKYVKPDIYYDVKKQGLSNDTPDADWYLKDFSGNGRDMQLYNFAKKLGSGVGKYEVDFDSWIPQYNVATSTHTPSKLHITSVVNDNGILYTRKATNAMKVEVTGMQSLDLVYRYITGDDTWGTFRFDGDGIYELPASGTTTKTYYTGFSVLNYIGDCDITIEQIPDYEGALVFDAVEDYGQFVGDLGLKDYTVAVDRAYVEAKGSQVPIISNVVDVSVNTPFLMEHLGIEKILAPHSFGTYTRLAELNINRFISYQSTYKYNGSDIIKGTSTNTGSGLTIGRIGGVANQYGKICLWSFLLFPYTLSEFLLERQLKRYKLGTLYPDMVEVRPIINSTGEYFRIEYRNGKGGLIQPGSYLPVGSILRISVVMNNDTSEVSSLKVNGVDIPETDYSNGRFYIYDATVTKSPQKIDITIDEYIRYEDIVQPYPVLLRFNDENGNEISWEGKFKVGSTITRIGSIDDTESNLLNGLYSISGLSLNGKAVTSSTSIVEKQMVFKTTATYLLDNNEPNCILSPRLLRIPNSSYKILGYIPDISGHGNHGVIHNSAYGEGSGVNEDGSYQFDGVDDFVTIPTLSNGGKQVLMKVNWQKYGAILYDQRGNNDEFAIYIYDEVEENIAYNGRNNGKTYIDGILNKYIKSSELKGILHDITITNPLSLGISKKMPTIGTSSNHNGFFSQMALFDFMLFDEISTDEEIKDLNDIVGIEGGYVESPDYYWDAYGKSNTQADDIDYKNIGTTNAKFCIYDKSITGLQALEDYRNGGSIVPVENRKLTLNKFAFNAESGYGGWLGIGNLTDALNYRGNSTTNNWKRGGTFLKDRNRNDAVGCGYAMVSWFDSTNHILKFKVKITGLTDADELYICQYNVIDPEIKQQLFNGINEVTLDLSASINPTDRYISFRYPPLTNDVDFEFLYEYQNGLVSDGVDDELKNTNMPVLTDYTWIMKRKRLKDTGNNVMAYKGNSPGSMSFMFELIENDTKNTKSFGTNSTLEGFADLISYQTKNSYNGTVIPAGDNADGSNLFIFRSREPYQFYCKGVFYKAMLYSKTIDMLSINMLKNLFEKDELIDVNNPIFKK